MLEGRTPGAWIDHAPGDAPVVGDVVLVEGHNEHRVGSVEAVVWTGPVPLRAIATAENHATLVRMSFHDVNADVERIGIMDPVDIEVKRAEESWHVQPLNPFSTGKRGLLLTRAEIVSLAKWLREAQNGDVDDAERAIGLIKSEWESIYAAQGERQLTAFSRRSSQMIGLSTTIKVERRENAASDQAQAE